MAPFSLRTAGAVVVTALAAACFTAIPANAAPAITRPSTVSSPAVSSPSVSTPPASPPTAPSDEAATDESTQSYEVEKHGSRVEVTNEEQSSASLDVSGTIINVAAEAPGEPTTFLLLDDVALPLDIELPAGVGTGSTFAGTLSLTDTVTDDLGVAIEQSEPVTTDSTLGELVTAAAIETSTELPVDHGAFSAPLMNTALTSTTRQINVAFVRPATGYSGITANTLGQDYFTQMVDTAEAYWVRESAGAITDFTMPSGDVPTIQSTYNCSSSTAAVNMWIKAWATYKQLNPSATTSTLFSFVIVVPHRACESTVGFIGLGNVGHGFDTTGQVGSNPQAYSSVLIDARSTGAQSGGVLIHELGHNFGLGHSDWYACTSSSYIDYKYTSGNSCRTLDYYDYYDPMGFEVDNPGVLSAPNKIKLGILTSGGADGYADVAPLPSGTTSSTTLVSIAPVSDASGVRAIRVKDPIYGRYYYVEYRSGTGADATALYRTLGNLKLSTASDQWSHGMGVRVLKNYGSGGFGDDTLELSSIPAGASPNTRDLSLGALDGFASYGGGIQVDVVSIDPGVEAEIQVTLRHSDVMAPKLSGPRFSGTGAVGSPLTFIGLKNWQIPGSTQTYSWSRNGYPICGLSSAATSYTPQSFDAGSAIAVRTTATKTYVTTGKVTARAIIPGGGDTAITRPTIVFSASPRQTVGGTTKTATVTIDGNLDGTLSLIDCNTSKLDGIPLTVGSPTTSFALPDTISAGYRSLGVAFVPNPGSDSMGAVSALTVVRVYRGSVRPVITPSTLAGTRNVPLTLHVDLAQTGGQYPRGTVSLYVNGTRTSSRLLSSTGQADFTYVTSGSGNKNFVVKYGGNSQFAESASTTTTIAIS